MCAVLSSAASYSAVIRGFLNKAQNYSARRRSSSTPPNRRNFIWHSLWARRSLGITFTLSASSHGIRTGLLRTIAMVWRRWSGDSRHACVRRSIAGEFGPAGTISDSASIETIWTRGSTTCSDTPGIDPSSTNPPQPVSPWLRRGGRTGVESRQRARRPRAEPGANVAPLRTVHSGARKSPGAHRDGRNYAKLSLQLAQVSKVKPRYARISAGKRR